ncbi:ABC transporter ATP-binding protein [Alkalicoccobacillus gibsonii]|uniref:ABC transporter ATP-binding protein n=1 Tax=Alkalicoccobacillus gibsonii TaxID=79881 RepID=UPI001933D84D|nr:ABC transporter ATP-binding protein [Alkalicoccobacillus gibsonii]MBM0067890.1 ABC transporter ATP-binding protein [Alkalicoccobacillus gibsonii]
MNTLEAKQIFKAYKNEHDEEEIKVLNGITLTVQKGESIAIMGPSGSGKTTLLNILSGMDQPTSGEVIIGEQAISNLKADASAEFRRKQLGFVFQDFNLLESLTVKENIMLPMILEKKSNLYMEARVDELASLFDIKAILNKYPYHISGGQQQRTAVSRALVNNPQILFADEPTGNLDSKSSAVIMEYFDHIVTKLHTTILLVTHDVFAASYCEKVYFINDGTIHSFISKNGGSKEAFLNVIMENLAQLGRV